MKVLYLTGFSDSLFKEKSTLWQDEAYLDKPCSVVGLLEAVSLLLVGIVAFIAFYAVDMVLLVALLDRQPAACVHLRPRHQC